MRLEAENPGTSLDYTRLEYCGYDNPGDLTIVRASERCLRRSAFSFQQDVGTLDGELEDEPRTEAEENMMESGQRLEFVMLRRMVQRGLDIRSQWREQGQHMIYQPIDDHTIMLGHPDGYLRYPGTDEWMVFDMKTTTKDRFNQMRHDFEAISHTELPVTSIVRDYFGQVRRYAAMTARMLREPTPAAYLELPKDFDPYHAGITLYCRETGEMKVGKFRIFDPPEEDPEEDMTIDKFMIEQFSLVMATMPAKPTDYFADSVMCRRCAFHELCYPYGEQGDGIGEKDDDTRLRDLEICDLRTRGKELQTIGNAMEMEAKERALLAVKESGGKRYLLTPTMSITFVEQKKRTRMNTPLMEEDGVLEKYQYRPGGVDQSVRWYPRT